jgi:hypothetical protein
LLPSKSLRSSKMYLPGAHEMKTIPIINYSSEAIKNKKITWLLLLFAVALSARLLRAEDTTPFRPPSVPLVTYNPFLSIWSPADRLNDFNTQHWTHRDHPLVSLIRVDGQSYRLMGATPDDLPPFEQISATVTPTRSIYEFEDRGVHVTLTFMEPALPEDLDVYSWPLSYITWSVRSVDGAGHKIELYDSTSSQLAVNSPDEIVAWTTGTAGTLTTLRIGTKEQPILGSSGDDHRINWGYAFAAASSEQSTSDVGFNGVLESSFEATGGLSQSDARQTKSEASVQPVMAFAFDLGNVRTDAVQRQVIVAYDEIYAIKYFGKKLRPYWARNGITIDDLLQKASTEHPQILTRCQAFDQELTADLTKVGGEKYAKIAALAYRECVAANGLAADANGKPLFFAKENTSDGDIATVDVFFPMDPIWLLLSPSLAKAALVPILMYSASDYWKFPNSPHDLGTYPIAHGPDAGGEAMPVEESGNMLILCDAISQIDGNTYFVKPWWPQLTQWAKYLEKYGVDPEDQLCTDDFMGHLAHNSNLSIKAILALAAYGNMCQLRGDTENAKKYADLSKADADHWLKVSETGDHSLLAFDKPGTWSQKYNLVWDRILGLNVFPPSVAQKEVIYYKTKLNKYGLPLDSRTKLSKSDWSMWCASLSDNQADFEAIVDPFYDYLNTTKARDPIADSYQTDDVNSGGMHARPVVGGFFIKMLTEPELWKKWASRDTLKPSNWAPIPSRPKITVLIPTGQQWRFTLDKPAFQWTSPSFDDSGWTQGTAGFGTNPPNFIRKTDWTSDDIWLRRKVTLPLGDHPNLQIYLYHDDDAEIYINGMLAAKERGFLTNFSTLEIAPEVRATLKPGENVTVAVHCHQFTEGQGIDVGFADVAN